MIRFVSRFFLRWGWALLVGVVALVLVGGQVNGRRQDAAGRAMLAAPRVGDLYVADFAQVRDPPSNDGPEFGIMRVITVGGGRVEVAVASLAYNKRRGPERDIASGRYRDDDYYTDEKVSFTLDTLRTLLDRLAIREVRRP